jgi:hypothetical protein
MRLIVYDDRVGIKELDEAIAGKNAEYELMLYVNSSTYDNDEDSKAEGLSAEDARSLFKSKHLVSLRSWELLNSLGYGAVASKDLSKKMAKMIKAIWISPERKCHIGFYTTHGVEGYAYYSLISKLLSSFGIQVEAELFYLSGNKGGLKGNRSLNLSKTPPFKELYYDTDTMALLQSLYILDKSSNPEEKIMINLSQLADIMMGKLPSVKGETRGFQGIYKRLGQKADILIAHGMVEGFSSKSNRMRLYAITNFGKLVAETYLCKDVSELLLSEMQDFLDDETGNMVKIGSQLKKARL